MGARPAKDRIANWLRDYLPGKLAYKITRAKNILLHQFMFKRARAHPEQASEFLTKKAKEALGDAWSEEHFRPPYNPWEQRLCLVPDEDFFIAVREGRASIVTDRIERFDEAGLQLQSGNHLDADIIVTATGLALTFGGKIELSIGGERIDWTRHWFYRGCMFDNVPNLAVTFGYLNASWTLRVDHNAAFLCEVFKLMDARGADTVFPHLPEDHAMEEDDIFSFSSGYLQRAKHLMPKSAAKLPWRLNQDYLEDRRHFRTYPVDDGILRFERHAVAQELETAE
jgi:cation diffusion facilitator CzcD-associated flavoprotein CzcO